jgi:hypothetical protein
MVAATDMEDRVEALIQRGKASWRSRCSWT